MQRLSILDWQCNLSFRCINLLDGESAHTLLHSFSCRRGSKSYHPRTRLCSKLRHGDLNVTLQSLLRQCSEIHSTVSDNIDELLDEEDELCPVECVREFKTDEEFSIILEKAKKAGSLVVVDFFRTACGSCKYIEQGFQKLCRGAGDEQAPVIFLKHNVIDEYDEQSEVAERLRIKTVPLFHFYKNGVLLEAFPTRDKERILAAILKYSAPASADA
uniref:Thioredoxin domain-containing protein n=1 Tax=Solanum lycopersicum TaxID=4081 RepID=A0A3Q7GA84_SOLLC|nr:thioredoxin-like 4, chloroplastic [Solanum lycopersicum]XP_010320332.1 thioredoxin-like 4, chloroplastic [Solanum lycopersicum]